MDERGCRHEAIDLDKRIKQLRNKRLRLLDEWFEKRSSFKTPETCQKLIIEIEDQILQLKLKQFEL